MGETAGYPGSSPKKISQAPKLRSNETVRGSSHSLISGAAPPMARRTAAARRGAGASDLAAQPIPPPDFDTSHGRTTICVTPSARSISAFPDCS